MPRRTASSSSATLRSNSAGGRGPAAAGGQAGRAVPPGASRESAERPEYRVEALAKGLRILSLFSEQRPSWRVSDLATAAGLPMPTVYRVVMTLASEGYLDGLPNGDYRPGVRTLTLGTAALRSLDLVAIATPKLQELGERTGETVNLAVLSADRVLYLIRLRNSDLVTANIQVGSTLPAVHTSIGKLLLAHLDEADLQSRITAACSLSRTGLPAPGSSRRRSTPSSARSTTRSPVAAGPRGRSCSCWPTPTGGWRARSTPSCCSHGWGRPCRRSAPRCATTPGST